LNPSAQVNNPIDMLGGAEPVDYGMALERLVKDPEVDLLLPILVPQALIHPADVAREILRATQGSDKPVIACFMGDQAVVEARAVLHEGGIPMYVFPDSVGKVLGALRRQGKWTVSPANSPITLYGIDLEKAKRHFVQVKNQASLGEADTRPLLEAYGIHLVKGMFARTAAEAGEAAETLGGRVALKVVSADLLHKSDVGGIRLGLDGREVTQKGFEEMMLELRITAPEARIEGVMVEEMAAKGMECIVGMRRDANFGPVMMFGMGGIYVELFADVAFRIAPVNVENALQMIEATKAGTLIDGYRGSGPLDKKAVVDCIMRLSQLALDFPEISEIEINPLMVYEDGHGALALDCRAIL
jgi:acetyltransferase